MVVDGCVSETSGVTVTLADLVDRMAETIQYYCNLPDPSFAVLIACWITNTYTFDKFAHFDLRPSNTGKQRGYWITDEWFAEWRARYPRKATTGHGSGQVTLLPPHARVNASNPTPNADIDESGRVNLTGANVSIPLSELGFDTLTDEIGGKEASV